MTDETSADIASKIDLIDVEIAATVAAARDLIARARKVGQ